MAEKKMKLWKKMLIGLFIVIFFIGIVGYFVIRNFFKQPQIESAIGSNEAIVETKNGKIMGSIEDGIYQYLGIPYAKAKERFVPAENVEAWDGVLEAVSVRAMSPQSGMLGMSAGNLDGTDNNCQNLNIWTPEIHDNQKRAVMVWLHGDRKKRTEIRYVFCVFDF